jgi:uncharacterized protein
MKLHAAAFETLPLGSIRPQGWIRHQLELQADGLTGHLEEHWPDVGEDNGWLGGTGDSWERGPYYLDGLVPLAYLLKDERLIAKANRWIEWSLASQREDGSFGPEGIQTVNQDVDKKQDWWHFTIMLKVLTQHEEATGDERVVPFLTKFLRHVHDRIGEQPLRGWAEARGADLLLSIVWLFKRTDEKFLLELAHTVAEQTTDWTGLFRQFPFWRKVEQWDWRTHVVNVAMGLKTPGVLFELTGDPAEREAVDRGIDSLMTYHGQAHGMFSGDEWLSGTHPSQGVELCAVVEYMFTMEQLVRIFGDGRFADILEKVAFNALPATISADWTSHQYDQQVNQIICNVAPRNWSNGPDANLFGLEPNFGCCTANMHQGWPKLVSHLWMSDGKGGLAAVSYAPCTVTASVGTGAHLQLEVGGDYPFREQVKIRLNLDRSETFAIALRIPAWCTAPVLAVNGSRMQGEPPVNGYVTLNQKWSDGDTVLLDLPMEVKTETRHLNAVSVQRGPLVYALPVGENWQMITQRAKFHDWEIYPSTPWKFGLPEGADFQVSLADAVPDQPFDASETPVRLKVNGQLVKNWAMEGNNAGTPPLVADTEGQPLQQLELVPYAAAKLRIAEFPLIAKRKHRM